MRRTLIEGLERRKEAMISALWANSNYDDDKGTRTKAIEEIEGNYREAITQIVDGHDDNEMDEIDNNNPFIKAAKRGVAKLVKPEDINAKNTVAEVIDYEQDIDQ
jgi:hypothetical protein